MHTANEKSSNYWFVCQVMCVSCATQNGNNQVVHALNGCNREVSRNVKHILSNTLNLKLQTSDHSESESDFHSLSFIIKKVRL